ncbi:unnamed protein product [Closterium sp. NIES-54]
MNITLNFITLYFIVTRLPDSLRSVRDHFLAIDPIVLTVDLLEQHLLAAETSVVAAGAACGTPPFFEGCSPSPLSPSYASAVAVDVLGAEDFRTASASGQRRSSKGKGGRGGGGGSGGGGGGSSGGVEAVEVVAVVGVVAGVGALVAVVGVSVVAAVGVVVVELELLSVEVLVVAKGSSSSSVGARPRRPSNFTCGKPHTQHHCFSCLDDTWRAEFGDEAERPRWAELLRSGVAIFDLDYDAILAAMHALSVSAEGDCYLCVPPDPGIEAAALGASESALPGTARAEALHTFTLDSGASRCFFRDSTTLTPLSAPVLVRLADPSGGQVLARSSTVLPCLAVSSDSLSGLHLPSFSANLVSASGPVAPPCSCPLLSHQTLPWHHCFGHPSLPRLCGVHSRFLVSGLPRSLPPLPPSPAPPCLPCVEGRQRAAPHPSSFPPTTAPLQTLHTDSVSSFASGSVRTFLSCVCTLTEVYAAHQLSIWLRVSLPETLPTLRWTGEVGDASVFRAWGSRAFVRDTSADNLSAHAIPCVRAPSGVSQVDPLLGTLPVEVAVDSGPAQGFASRGTASGGAEPVGAEPGGAESEGARSGGAEPGGVELGGAEPAGVESGGAEPEGVEPGGAEPRGTASSGYPAGTLPCLSPRPEPQSPQQLREWFTKRTRLLRGAAGAGDSAAGDTGAGGAGVTSRAGGTRGTAAAGPGGARTRGTGAAGTGGVGGAGAGDPTEPGAVEVGGAGAGGTGAGDAGAGGVGAVCAGARGTGERDTGAGGARAVDPGAGGAGAGGVVSGGTGAGGTLRLRPYLVVKFYVVDVGRD